MEAAAVFSSSPSHAKYDQNWLDDILSPASFVFKYSGAIRVD